MRRRRPFVTEYPNAAASKGVRRLARTLIEERRPRPRRTGLVAALAGRWGAWRPEKLE